MSSEMTPEEKLLALIQQDRQPAGGAAAPAPKAGAPPQPPPPQATAAVQAPVVPPVPPAPPAPAVRAVPSVRDDAAPSSPVRTPEKGRPLAESQKPVAPVPVEVSATVAATPEKAPPPVSAVVPASPPGTKPVSEGTASADASKPLPEPADKERDAGRKLKLAAVPVEAKTVSTTVSAQPVSAPPAAPAVAFAESAPEPQLVPSEKVTAIASAAARPTRLGLSGFGVLNRALGMVVLVLLVAVVYSGASIRSEVGEALKRQKEGAGGMPLVPGALDREVLPPLEDTVVKAAGRNFFLPPKQVSGVTNAPPGFESLKDLKLIGVSLDNAAPEKSMAIIKNKATSKTLFVTPGQTVGDTGLVLVRVSGDRAIVRHKKAERELK